MEWEIILADAVKNGMIRELHLRKLPMLKTTANWKGVEMLGWVDHQMKYTHYKGALMKLNDKLYFVRESTINALKPYIKWKTITKIKVIPEV